MHEGRGDEDGLRRRRGAAFADEAEKIDGGSAAHVVKRLVDGGEAGADGGGSGNVVKADDGDVAGDVEPGLMEGGDGAHGGYIV